MTPKVGFDNLDLAAWGAIGMPVCNVPDYGTQEVADHAMALMLSLMKGITFHTRELKKDPKGLWRPALNPENGCLPVYLGWSAWAVLAQRRRCAPRPSAWMW